MLTVVFWNVDENTASFPSLVRLAQTRQVDVLFIAEPPDDMAPLINNLNTLGIGSYRDATQPPLKVKIITRLKDRTFRHSWTNLAGDVGICVCKTTGVMAGEVLVATVHLPSKAGGNTPGSQASAAIEAAEELAGFEDRRRPPHRNTVVVGDFNMEPFDPGMTLVTGMHALMTLALSQQADRRDRGSYHRRFYNPMWGMFGDRTPGPAGTHFWDSSVIENHHWAMLDQVLIRADIAGKLTELAILDHDGSESLVADDGIPSKHHLSDHLPILFRLDL